MSAEFFPTATLTIASNWRVPILSACSATLLSTIEMQNRNKPNHQGQPPFPIFYKVSFETFYPLHTPIQNDYTHDKAYTNSEEAGKSGLSAVLLYPFLYPPKTTTSLFSRRNSTLDTCTFRPPQGYNSKAFKLLTHQP